MILLVAGVFVLMFSLYQFFISDDALTLSLSLLRVFLSVLGLIALRFDEEVMLTASVLMYALISLLLLAMVRSEVQFKND